MLERIFDADNVVWRIVSRFGDICFLNFLFIISAWPIITIGPALCALFSVTLKMVKQEDCGIAKAYIKAFKENFKQAFILGLITIFTIFIVSFDVYFISIGNTNLSKIMVYLIYGVAVFAFFIFEYIFAILARFDNSIKNTIKNAILMVLANFPKTLLISASTLAFVYFSTFDAQIIIYGITFWFLCGFALWAYCNSIFLREIFAKYEASDNKLINQTK